jgi:cobalt-zinc-cadmium efflux system protein
MSRRRMPSGESHLPKRPTSDRLLIGSRHVSRSQRLTVVLILNLALVAGLVTVGLAAHSLAVLAEGSDYLLDAAGVGVALLALSLSARPASRIRPEGYPNAANLAALVNGGWLLVLELLVVVASGIRCKSMGVVPASWSG